MLQIISEQIEAIKNELERIAESNQDMQVLMSIPKCGLIIASSMLSEIEDIRKYQTSGSLAKYAGIAPREHTSARKVRHYSDYRGNRHLNYSFYLLALTQLSRGGSEVSKNYFQKKVTEGKSKMHAIRCLKRKFVDLVYALLKSGKKYVNPLLH